MTKSMHIVYGGSIVILALVISGMVLVLGNVQVPFVTAYFQTPVPPPLVFQHTKSVQP